MTDYNNGQIWGWNGGECPVHPETVVEYWMQICAGSAWGEVCAGSAWGEAGGLLWDHSKSPGDIIAFRVVKQHVEPKVIWVNEYPEELVAHHDRLSAISSSTPRATRIAVKYVEARDD